MLAKVILGHIKEPEWTQIKREELASMFSNFERDETKSLVLCITFPLCPTFFSPSPLLLLQHLFHLQEKCVFIDSWLHTICIGKVNPERHGWSGSFQALVRKCAVCLDINYECPVLGILPWLICQPDQSCPAPRGWYTVMLTKRRFWSFSQYFTMADRYQKVRPPIMARPCHLWPNIYFY